MTRPAVQRRSGRIVVAVVLVVLAVIAIIVEPFPKGFVLLVITETHGIDAGDLPAVALLAVAGWLLWFG